MNTREILTEAERAQIGANLSREAAYNRGRADAYTLMAALFEKIGFCGEEYRKQAEEMQAEAGRLDAMKYAILEG